MVGIGLGVLWIGYTAFAYGRALTKGAQVTFTDMVLPSHRQYAISQIQHSQLPGTGSGGGPGLLDQVYNLFRPNPVAAGAPTFGLLPNPTPTLGTK